MNNIQSALDALNGLEGRKLTSAMNTIIISDEFFNSLDHILQHEDHGKIAPLFAGMKKFKRKGSKYFRFIEENNLIKLVDAISKNEALWSKYGYSVDTSDFWLWTSAKSPKLLEVTEGRNWLTKYRANMFDVYTRVMGKKEIRTVATRFKGDIEDCEKVLEILDNMPENISFKDCKVLYEFGCRKKKSNLEKDLAYVEREGVSREDIDTNGANWAFYNEIVFPAGTITRTKWEMTNGIHFSSGGEIVITEIRQAKVVLAPFAYADNQFYFCVNLAGDFPNYGIDVYNIDHDGTGASFEGSLERFLNSLRKEK